MTGFLNSRLTSRRRDAWIGESSIVGFVIVLALDVRLRAEAWLPLAQIVIGARCAGWRRGLHLHA